MAQLPICFTSRALQRSSTLYTTCVDKSFGFIKGGDDQLDVVVNLHHSSETFESEVANFEFLARSGIDLNDKDEVEEALRTLY